MTITIISLLSSIATISYTSARVKGRDARRLADMDVMRTALELYFHDHEGYPADGRRRMEGIVLGQTGATVLSNNGFSDTIQEPLYVQPVPHNPIGGGGADYVYYSLNIDDTHCDTSPCAKFRIDFALEGPVYNMQPGAYVSGPIQTLPAPPEIAEKILARTAPSALDRTAVRVGPYIDRAVAVLGEAKRATIDNPTVKEVSSQVVAPVSTAAVVVSTATGLSGSASALSSVSSAVSAATSAASSASAVQTATTATAAAASSASALGQLGALFYLALSQPFLLMRKRKEYAWGVVYDSQKKMPLDLAIVRLIDANSGRVVQTRVTDKAGRIFFFAPKGTYRIEVAKPGFAFPSSLLSGEREDGKFANLYFGQKFSVSGSGQVVNPSIPLDPSGADLSDKEFIKRFVRSKARYFISGLGIALNVAAAVINPTYPVLGLLALNVLLFAVFRRLSHPKQPAEWGTVRDERTGRVIPHAVVRLFSSPYNKLVETRVTDGHGRYNFVVGQNVFFLTATSQGYWKTESYPLDLRGSEKPQIISAPVAMRPLSKESQKNTP